MARFGPVPAGRYCASGGIMNILANPNLVAPELLAAGFVPRRGSVFAVGKVSLKPPRWALAQDEAV